MQTKSFTVRISVPEYQATDHLAKGKDISLSEYVRQAVVEKNASESVIAQVESARNDIKDLLDAFRSEVGRLHHNLIQSQRLANEALAIDLETKLAEEVDDQRQMLVELFNQFASYTEAQGSLGMPPMQTPSSR